MIPTKLLQCPICQHPLEETINPHLFSCGNHTYPYFHGIIYLYHPRPDALVQAVNSIHSNQLISAQIHLLGNTYKQGFFALILTLVPIPTLLKQPLFRLLSSLLSYLSPSSKSWYDYLKNHPQLKTHQLALQIKQIQKPTGTLVDLGCGPGHFLASDPAFPQQMGIDNNPLNLLLARRFFVSADTFLLCADLNQPIPLKSATIITLTMHDAFYDIRSKTHLLHQAKRVLKTSGTFIITGIDTPHPHHLSPFPISPADLEKISPFPYRRYIDDDIFYLRLRNHHPLKLSHTQVKNLDKAQNFSAFFKKQPFSPSELDLVT